MTYDHWKTHSPDDDYPDDDYEDACEHEDYDIDILDGRAHCDRCGESWYASNEEILATIDHMARYAEYEERENRRQWWRDLWSSVCSIIPKRKHPVNIDDDLPF